MNDRRFGTAAASLLAAVLVLSSCADQDDDSYVDNHAGHSPRGPETAEIIMPYGEGFEHLQGQPPEAVAETALLRLAHATPAQVEDQDAAAATLRGVVTPELWTQLRDDPASVVPTMTGPAWRAWDSAGGGVTVTVRQDEEQHPPDTDTTWTRKWVVTRQLAGSTSPLDTTYAVALRKISGQWRVSDLRLLG